MKKKLMRVVEDKKQKRVGIPKEFVKALDIDKEDKFEFEHNESKKTLNAKLIKKVKGDNKNKKTPSLHVQKNAN